MNVMIREKCGKQVHAAFGDEVAVLAASIENRRINSEPLRIGKRIEGPVESRSAQSGALTQLDAAVHANPRVAQHDGADPALRVGHAPDAPGMDVTLDH